MHLRGLVSSILFVWLATGCGGISAKKNVRYVGGSQADDDALTAERPQQNGENPTDSVDDGEIAQEAPGLSLTSRMRMKDVERLENDIAQALELPKSDLCQELGTLSCTGDVHKLNLGGVDAYEKKRINWIGTKGVILTIG